MIEVGAHCTCHGIAETQRRSSRLATLLQPGDVICLYGELGAGKTYFVKGLVAGLGGDADEVTSPTFVLMQSYRTGRLPVYHYDAYRLHDSRDLVDIGSDEVFSGDGVTAIEWSDRVPAALPAERLEVHLTPTGLEDRAMRLIGRGGRPAALVTSLIALELVEAEDSVGHP